MEYQILANKWRPKIFDHIVGQDEILFVLKKSITLNKIHHAYLISGPQGTGKTTIARIFSKHLNCNTGITLTPCNKCKSCVNINKENNLDIIEIDAASKTKIDDIKNLISSSKYMTMYSRFKIYIIDEIHMLSINSFNALLKTLEEPYNNVKFILITTNIKKLPQTIISRCINLNVQKISNENIQKRLITILNNENITYKQNILTHIANFSDGSLRQAINTLEKIIPDINNHTEQHIEQILNITPKKTLLSIIIASYNKDIGTIQKITTNLQKKNIDIPKLLTQLQMLLHELILYKLTNNKISHNILSLPTKLTIEILYNYYKIISEEKINIHYSPNYLIGLEMTLIKMILLKFKL